MFISVVELNAIFFPLPPWLSRCPVFELEGTGVRPFPRSLLRSVVCSDPHNYLTLPNPSQQVVVYLFACHRRQMTSFAFTEILCFRPSLCLISHPEIAPPIKWIPAGRTRVRVAGAGVHLISWIRKEFTLSLSFFSLPKFCP